MSRKCRHTRSGNEILEHLGPIYTWKISLKYRDILHQIEILLKYRVYRKKQYCSWVPSISSGIPKYHPDQLNHPSRHPNPKDTKIHSTDTARCLQTIQDNFQTLLKMHDRVRLEPILPFGKTVKGKTFFM